MDRFDGSRGYYLYDPKGNVTGITNGEGQVYQSYRYGSFGEITFGAPQYENEYTYNGESYNPNIESQYLRARYYNVVHANFLTEDSYLGNIYEPLTLNRYNYCVSNPVNYRDPSGNAHVIDELGQERYFSPRSDDVSLPEAETSVYYEIAEEAMAPMNSFIMGFGVSEMTVLQGVGDIVYYPGLLFEKVFGIQNGPNQQMFDSYNEGIEYMLMNKVEEAKDRTAFYAGQCTADAINIVMGSAIITAGGGKAIDGVASIVTEASSGVGVVAVPASIAKILEGVIIFSVGAVVTKQGMTSFMQDSSNYQESKASKDTTSGESSSEGGSNFKGQPYNGTRNPDVDFVNGKGKSTLNRHAFNHGYTSPEEYLNDARHFLEKEPTATTQSFVSEAGTYFRYDTETNEFGIINEYGGISTYFKPDNEMDYWLEQIEKYAPK